MSVLTWAGLAKRNPSYITTNTRASWAVSKAMRTFAKDNLTCAWCGRSARLQVHHIHPVSVAPEKAADPANMVMLCGKGCHLYVGHLGDFADSFVEDIVNICSIVSRVKVAA